MRVAPELVLPKIRCAAVHGSFAVDPAGTAPYFDGALAVALRLPWPRDIGESDVFEGLLGASDQYKWRPQGLVPSDEGRVIAYKRVGPGGSPFQAREWINDSTAPAWTPAELARLCEAVVSGDPAQLEAFDKFRSSSVSANAQDNRDLLICTHGTRDVCCGAAGPVLYDAMNSEGGATDLASKGLRVFRTSHTGGHRFAATAISFPDGYAWAHLDAQTSSGILDRKVDPVDLRLHCRGSVSLPPGVAQVADREALAHFGWDWADVIRSVVVVAHERDTLATTIETRAEIGGRQVGIAVRVELEKYIAKPTCGESDEPEFKTEPVWVVPEVTELS